MWIHLVRILVAPIFQMRTSTAPSLRTAGGLRSVCLPSRYTKLWAASSLHTHSQLPAAPCSSLSPASATGLPARSTLSGEGRSPMTQGREKKATLWPGAGTAGSPCCHRNQQCSQHGLPCLPSPAIRAKDYVFTFSWWH